MITHLSLGGNTFSGSRKLHQLINTGEIKLGGNARLKIYGTLRCKSGRRMKTIHRVFFATEAEAIESGYRPCGHCMSKEYKRWKK